MRPSFLFASLRTAVVLAILIGFSHPGQEDLKAETDGDVFRAGASASNITPPLGELIVGGWKPVPATHIHD
ncbi:MAG: hypothetical protein ABGX07_14110, partial [Pirellulaceae bacterium]